MVNSASDEQRTRLLHSLEVQRIAKKIALGIGANAELAENIAIAHDIGHAPFGHSGEDAINEFLTPKTKSGQLADSDAHFLHAMQSVKILDKIATHTYLQKHGIDGLGLSDYVLEGVLKHDSDVFAEKLISADISNQYSVRRLCGIVGVEDYNTYINQYLTNASDTILPEVLIGSIESQIVAWADKIAYLGHDWEEFLDTKLLEKLMSRLNDMIREIFVICESRRQSNIYVDEFRHLELVKQELQKIEKEYSIGTSYKDVWFNSVRDILIEIIKIIAEIEELSDETNFFTLKEYKALKDYFAMVLSWVQLTDTYPQPYAMKYDPIYIFYMYLSGVRTTVITRKVTDKLIKGTIKTLAFSSTKVKNQTRAEYLGYCNHKWVRMYRSICSDISDKKKRKKSLKNNVRECYLVKFARTKKIGANLVEVDYDDITPITIEKYDYYSFYDTYCCLLNIINCIFSQYICSTRVSYMTQQAKKIVTGLMEYYVAHPEMLPYSQRKRYKKDLKKPNNELLYFIADYVGGMTDRMAKKKYDEIMSSDTKWSNEYSSGLN